MKTKARLNKSDNTTVVEYFKLKKPFKFRYNLLKGIIESFDQVTIFVDTNSKTKTLESNIVTYCSENEIECKSFPLKKRERKLFGFSLNGLKKRANVSNEKFIIAKISPKDFTSEFFDKYIKTYDLAIGVEPTLGIDEMAMMYKDSIHELYFNKEYFKEFTYDSILFQSIRSTIDISEIAAKSESLI